MFISIQVPVKTLKINESAAFLERFQISNRSNSLPSQQVYYPTCWKKHKWIRYIGVNKKSPWIKE